LRFSVEEFPHPNTGFNVLPAVYEVDGDEKVWTLAELSLAPVLGGMIHRYQIIIVRRDIGKCQYIEDMGLAELFLSGPKAIPCNWLHSVAEAKEMADQLREIDMEKIIGPDHEDLVGGFHDRVEEFFLEKNRVSVSGSYQKVERS
jgi:hypothetical protein